MIPEMIDFQGKKWQVVGKCSGERIDDHTKLKENYGCDLVLKNNQGCFLSSERNNIFIH